MELGFTLPDKSISDLRLWFFNGPVDRKDFLRSLNSASKLTSGIIRFFFAKPLKFWNLYIYNASIFILITHQK